MKTPREARFEKVVADTMAKYGQIEHLEAHAGIRS